MKRNIILVVLSVVFSHQIFIAQLLWRIQYPGSENISYIIGTHHLVPISIIDSIAGLKNAINYVDTIYGEIDLSVMKLPQIRQLMNRAMSAPNDSTLDMLLTNDQLDSLGFVISSYDLKLETIRVMKPSAISTILMMFATSEILPGGIVDKSMDEYIQERGRSVGKHIKYLESVEYQIELLYGNSLKNQAIDLMRLVANFEHEKELSKQLTHFYISQNFHGLENLILSSSFMPIENAQRLIYDRNQAWISLLSPILMHQRALIAVGVAHLVGPFGMLEKLCQYGYSVTPVR